MSIIIIGDVRFSRRSTKRKTCHNNLHIKLLCIILSLCISELIIKWRYRLIALFVVTKLRVSFCLCWSGPIPTPSHLSPTHPHPRPHPTHSTPFCSIRRASSLDSIRFINRWSKDGQAIIARRRRVMDGSSVYAPYCGGDCVMTGPVDVITPAHAQTAARTPSHHRLHTHTEAAKTDVIFQLHLTTSVCFDGGAQRRMFSFRVGAGIFPSNQRTTWKSRRKVIAFIFRAGNGNVTG